MTSSTGWERADDIATVSADRVAYLRRHWEDGWNQNDTDLIVEPFSADVVFSSPFVPRIMGDPTVTEIRGFDAVRQYVADSLVRATQGIQYRADRVDAGTLSVAITYRVLHPAGERLGLDVMRLDEQGKVDDWRCHYPFDGYA